MRAEEPHRALQRLLANGPLTAMPVRPADQRLLAVLAASRFEPGRDYGEREVNETLAAWLATFCAPHSIDHATLRRLLVDSRLMARTATGSSYCLDAGKVAEVQAVAEIDPARVLAEVRHERASRKRHHAP